MFTRTFTLSMTAILLTVTTSVFSQAKSSSNSEMKKIASNLIECYYLTKASSLTNSPDCNLQLKERISGLSSLLQSAIDGNKTSITQKIGADNLKELQTFTKQTSEYAINKEELTTEKRASLTLWVRLWKSVIEDIFVKLNK